MVVWAYLTNETRYDVSQTPCRIFRTIKVLYYLLISKIKTRKKRRKDLRMAQTTLNASFGPVKHIEVVLLVLLLDVVIYLVKKSH